MIEKTIKLKDDGNRHKNNLFSKIIIPFPAWFFQSGLMAFKSKGQAAFLNGHHSSGHGWWYYHIFAFLIKVPITTLLLLIITLVLILFKTKEFLTLNEKILIIPIIIFVTFVSIGNTKIGLRHILPIFPFLFVLLSKLYTVRGIIRVPQSLFGCFFAGIVIFYLASSISIYPNYLAYFNETIGGPGNGYKYLIDSNIDWGQDLKLLKKYMEKNNIKKVKLSYLGGGDPTYYGIEYEYLPSVGLRPNKPEDKWWYEKGYEEKCGPTNGLIAISVNNLQGLVLKDKQCFQWLKKYEPIKKIGYSIFIYDIPVNNKNA